MNYMKQVAEMLGVELGEEFSTKECPDCTYTLTQDGLFYKGKTVEMLLQRSLLSDILAGKRTISKKPWKPKKGDTYFYISSTGEICWTSNDYQTYDIAMQYMGNCFKTEADANAHKDEIIVKFKEVMGQWND